MTTTATRPVGAQARASITARTLRTDRWWFAPLITVIGLGAWVTYATVRVYMHKDFFVQDYHYLTPFYSPCITDRCGDAAEFGTRLGVVGIQFEGMLERLDRAIPLAPRS